MHNLSTRLAIGFAAGALSHLMFQGGLGTVYHFAGLIPSLPWSLDPVAPLGVPRTPESRILGRLVGFPVRCFAAAARSASRFPG